MSAFILSFRDCSILGEEVAFRVKGCEGRAVELAAAFHAENRTSVGYRYPDEMPWNLPGVTEEVGKPFAFQGSVQCRSGISDAALAKLLRCWQYQTCEYPEHEQGEAWQLAEALLSTFPKRGEGLPDYEDAAWGDYDPATDPGRVHEAAKALRDLLGETVDSGNGSSPDVPTRLYGRDLSTAIKQHLTDTFPGTRFSVKGSRGTATGWFSVDWTDGPSYEAVNAEASRFESSRFNGMHDGYDRTEVEGVKVRGRWVLGTSCGINCSRTISEGLARSIAAQISQRYNWAMPTGQYSRGDWWSQYPEGDRQQSWQHYVSRALAGQVEGVTA